MRKIFTVLMAGAALALAGCGKHDQKTVYSDGKGNTVATSASGDHMTITGSNGEKVEVGTGSAAKMPGFLPLFPGATVTTSIVGQGTGNGGGPGGMVAFKTSASPADVIAFYKQKTKASGFVESMNMDSNGTMMFASANAQSKMQLSVTAAKESDGTQASLSWGSGK